MRYYKEWWYKYLPTYVDLDENDIEDYLGEVERAMWADGYLYDYEEHQREIKQLIKNKAKRK